MTFLFQSSDLYVLVIHSLPSMHYSLNWRRESGVNARLHHPRDELVSSHHLIGGWYFKPARGSCSVIKTWGLKEYS